MTPADSVRVEWRGVRARVHARRDERAHLARCVVGRSSETPSVSLWVLTSATVVAAALAYVLAMAMGG